MVGGDTVHTAALSAAPDVARTENDCGLNPCGGYFNKRCGYAVQKVEIYDTVLTGYRLAGQLEKHSFVFRFKHMEALSAFKITYTYILYYFRVFVNTQNDIFALFPAFFR